MADENYKINLDGKEAEKTIGTLNLQVKELTEHLENCVVGTEEFAKTSKQLESVKDELNAINQTSLTMGDNISKVTQGIVGGFLAGLGALSAFGIESESSTKAMLKMMAVMSLGQGIKSITEAGVAMKTLYQVIKLATNAKKKDTAVTVANTTATVAGTAASTGQAVATSAATKAQWSLNAAMSANPIGAIITAIVTLISLIVMAVDLIGDWIGGTESEEEAQERLNRQIDNFNKLADEQKSKVEKTTKAHQQQIEMMEAEGKSEDEIYKQKVANLKQEIKLQQSATEAIYQKLKALEAEWIADGKLTRIGNKLSGSKDYIDRYREMSKAYNDAKEMSADLQHDLNVMEALHNTNIKKTQAELAKTAVQNRVNAIKELNKLIEDINKKRRTSVQNAKKQITDQYNEELKLVENNLKLFDKNSDNYKKTLKVKEELTKQYYIDIAKVENEDLNRIAEYNIEKRKLTDEGYAGTEQAINDEIALLKKKQKQMTEKVAVDGQEGATLENIKQSKEYLELEKQIVQKQNEKLDIQKALFKAQLEYEVASGKKTEKQALEETLSVQQSELLILEEGTQKWYEQSKAIEETKKKLVEAMGIDSALFDAQTVKYASEEEAQIAHLDAMQVALETAKQQGLLTEEQYTLAVKNLKEQQAQADKDYVNMQIQNSVEAMNGLNDILGSITSIVEAEADAQINNLKSQLDLGLITEEQYNEQSEQLKREAFEKSKKMQIAMATIQMITGIASALAMTYTTHTGVWDWVLGGIQAASIAAAGIANIALINATQYEGASGSASTASSSAVNSTLIAPTQYSQEVSNARLEEKVGDTKVYVTESDIQRTTKKVSVAESESRY